MTKHQAIDRKHNVTSTTLRERVRAFVAKLKRGSDVPHQDPETQEPPVVETPPPVASGPDTAR